MKALCRSIIVSTCITGLAVLSSNAYAGTESSNFKAAMDIQSSQLNIKKVRNDRKFSSHSLKTFVATSVKKTSKRVAPHVIQRVLPTQLNSAH